MHPDRLRRTGGAGAGAVGVIKPAAQAAAWPGCRGRGTFLSGTATPGVLRRPLTCGDTIHLADLHTPQAVTAYHAALPWLDDLARLWDTYLNYGGFPVSVAAAKQGQPVPGWFVNALFDVIHRDAFGGPIDPLIARLPHLRQGTRDDIDPTLLAEAQTGTALRRAALRERSTWDSDSTLFHLRTTTRKEIDFVAAEFSGAAVEGKYTDGGSWRSQARTVDASPYRGILTTRSVLDVSATGGMAWAIPAALLAVLVDS